MANIAVEKQSNTVIAEQPAPLDKRTLYETKNAFLTAPENAIGGLTTNRFIGQKVVIQADPENDGKPREYWFKDGITDADLVRYDNYEWGNSGGGGVDGRWLPNETANLYSTGVMSGGSIAVNTSSHIGMYNGSYLYANSGGGLYVYNSGRVDAHDEGFLCANTSGKVDVHSNGKLYANTGGMLCVSSGKVDVRYGGEVDVYNSGRIRAVNSGMLEIFYSKTKFFPVLIGEFENIPPLPDNSSYTTHYNYNSNVEGDRGIIMSISLLTQTLWYIKIKRDGYEGNWEADSEWINTGGQLTSIPLLHADRIEVGNAADSGQPSGISIESQPTSFDGVTINRGIPDGYPPTGINIATRNSNLKLTPSDLLFRGTYPFDFDAGYKELKIAREGVQILGNNESVLLEKSWQDILKDDPKGTSNQVILGDGSLTPKQTEDGEYFNAASSLFAEGDVRNDAPDALYGEFESKGERISWDSIASLLYNEVFHRLDEGGFLGGGGGVSSFINSVTIAIAAPANGQEMSNEAHIANENPNFSAGTIVWTPDDEIANGTSAYTGVFTIQPDFPWQFHPGSLVLVNGGEPSERQIQSDLSMRITMNYPAAMTALPQPSLSMAEPEYNANRPATAAQNDAGAANYSNAIAWEPPGATFPQGESTGTFTLTANSSFRWNANIASLNGVNYNGALSDDGMTLSFAAAFESDRGTFTDPRDGKIYPWRIMPDGKKWMTVNLDYNQNGSVYYNNAANPPFANAGRLYTFDQAVAAAAGLPAGWHLPSDADWAALAIAAGGAATAGTKLKAVDGWTASPNIPLGTDDYGFAGRPSGMYSLVFNMFIHINNYGMWWSSTADGSSNAFYHELRYNYIDLNRYSNNKNNYVSIRCMKD